MNFSRNQIIIIGAVVAVVLFFVLLFMGIIPGLKPAGSGGLGIGGPTGGQQTKLAFWGTAGGNNANAIQKVIEKYSQKDAAVSVSYKEFDNAADYEKSLINALATGHAPDIFMFHSGWLRKHYDKVYPAPDTLNAAYVQQMFPDVVAHDFVLQGKVYALPLYIDTIAFIYNKDIFNAKSIAVAPRAWVDFQSFIPRLREVNLLNQITKPAAAIGGSEKSVSDASDLLSLLMLQYKSQMLDSQGKVSFGNEGLNAFNFYLQFADPSSQYYTWNDNIGNSIDDFSNGDAAIIFDYQSALAKIKEKNPYMNIGVGQMLQFDLSQPVDYADYWGLAVSYQSANKVAAWNFVAGVTADQTIADTYLQTSGKPPALRSLIDKYKNDPDLGVFAKQALTARSWTQPDVAEVRQTFSNMIESVLNGKLSSDKAIKQAESQINSL